MMRVNENEKFASALPSALRRMLTVVLTSAGNYAAYAAETTATTSSCATRLFNAAATLIA